MVWNFHLFVQVYSAMAFSMVNGTKIGSLSPAAAASHLRSEDYLTLNNLSEVEWYPEYIFDI